MALTLLASNNASSVLAAGISSSATTLTVNTGTGPFFPVPTAGTSYFKLTLIDAATGTLTEIVHVTAVSGDVFTIIRAQEGTSARIWSANDIAANMFTAGTLGALLQIANSLSEIATSGAAAQASARTNLGLGGAATLNIGTAAGTVAAGNDSRITGAAQKTNNLSDLANAANARSNLGLGTAATFNTGNGTGQIPTMTNFTSGSGWIKFPDGTIIQRGTSISGPIGYPLAIPLPIAFTNSFTIATSFDTASNIATDCPSFSTTPIGLAGFYLSSSRPSSSGTGAGANWIAVGK